MDFLLFLSIIMIIIAISTISGFVRYSRRVASFISGFVRYSRRFASFFGFIILVGVGIMIASASIPLINEMFNITFIGEETEYVINNEINATSLYIEINATSLYIENVTQETTTEEMQYDNLGVLDFDDMDIENI